jgi:nucleoside-diphosphate kinase
MSLEYTLSIIKPDATERNITGQINAYLENAGLKIVAQKMLKLSQIQAKEFYFEHAKRPFFENLIKQITSAPVIVQVLSGQNAISLNRKIMGATNPSEADNNTIRKDFGISIDENSVHGSDSAESASREIKLFFNEEEIVG